MKILPLGSLGYVASLLAAILYHRNSYMKHSLWDIVLIVVQWNLSKPNPFRTINFVRNRQVKFTKIYNLMFSLHRISVYSGFMCWWNVTTYKWKVHNRKIRIICVIIIFRSETTLTLN